MNNNEQLIERLKVMRPVVFKDWDQETIDLAIAALSPVQDEFKCAFCGSTNTTCHEETIKTPYRDMEFEHVVLVDGCIDCGQQWLDGEMEDRRNTSLMDAMYQKIVSLSAPVQSEEVESQKTFWIDVAKKAGAKADKLEAHIKELKTKAKSDHQLAQRNSAYTTKLEAQIKEYQSLCITEAAFIARESGDEDIPGVNGERFRLCACRLSDGVNRIAAMTGEDDE